ncbi:phage major capsid protein [Nocardia tengchongensis]|uniref:phage major capsid protein n=1 Tax=Nocardia tengchongensis TaxID=2055889 RepID=UPI0036676A1C
MTGNVTFAPSPATLSGDIIAINRFLKDPLWVMRALRTITEQMFIANKVLTSQMWTESGTVGYEQNENIYADNSPQPVAPGAEYPITTTGTGPASMANVVNWGQDSIITDASISRQKFDVVGRAFTKLANGHVQKIDSVALSAVASAVTQNTAALSSWAGTGAAPAILRDIMRAFANIVNLKQGYMPDTVLLDTTTFANVVSDDKLAALLPREVPGVSNSPVLAGWDSAYMKRIGGFTFLGSPNLPVAGVATLLDSKVFGGFTDEKQAAPGYVMSTGKDGMPDADGLQVKTIRKDDTDSWRIRCRRITVPVVLEPRAAWQITGVNL